MQERPPLPDLSFHRSSVEPTKRRAFDWKKGLHVSALTLVSVASVGFLLVMSSLPRVEGRIPARYLDLPATITRDPAGIPVLSARTPHDAFYMLGWIHAQDRLWQMEISRRTVNGTLSEMVGEAGLANDRFMRTLGLSAAARQSFASLDGGSRDVLAAYSQGVNAWIDDHRHRLPPQFSLLNHSPLPWTPQDSLSIARLIAFQLSNSWQSQIQKARISTRLGDLRRLNELWPNGGQDGPVTLSAAQADSLLAAIPDQAMPRLASNVWVVSGQKTQSGKPLLANDPHMNFTFPGYWYLAALNAPGLAVSGATLPGLPVVMIGRNDRIAWGLTSTAADVVDVVVEQVRPDGLSYQANKGTETFRLRDEIIRIRDRQDMVMTVRETRHGPVISDLAGIGWTDSGQVMALRSSIFAGDDISLQAMLKINQAVDWRSFNEALRDLQNPVLNIAYADITGNIGLVTAGHIPIRKDGDTTLPMRGWLNEGDWKGRIPFDKLPRQYNPPSGMLVNANNRVVGKAYPYSISASWPPGYRAARIMERLEGRRDLTVAAMRDIQSDDVSLACQEIKASLPFGPYANPATTIAARMVQVWDGQMDRYRAEPLIFYQWMRELWKSSLADDLGDDFSSFQTVKLPVLRDILTKNRQWCENKLTGQNGQKPQSCDQLAMVAFERAISDLTATYGQDMRQWRWGLAHRITLSDPVLNSVPGLGRLSSILQEADGDNYTINAGNFRDGSFADIHGPGARLIFDLADNRTALGIIAGGQSGNPLSRHYADLLPKWSTGDLLPIGAVGQRGSARLLLEPVYVGSK